MAYNKARTPVIALDYKDKHKAIEKEILIDYENGGHIYVVSATDREVIFDVTKNILNSLELVTGEHIEVEIEGVGRVNLTEFLNTVKVEINRGIKAHPISDEVSYISKNNVYDHRSIDVRNNDVQLKGFREAPVGTFPIKGKDGKISWVKLADDFQGTNLSGIERDRDHKDIIGPSNPDNGQRLEASDNPPYNGKVYLRSSRNQVTTDPMENLVVVLPKDTLDRYSRIRWMLLTSEEFCPELKFDGKIQWDNSMDTQPAKGSHNLYTFETWTGGEMWIGRAETFNNTGFTNVSSEYLNKHYYNKHDLDGSFYNKAYIDEHFYNKEGTEDKIAEYKEEDNVWHTDL
jgi:hypothetical protein|nr:MAG TPA: hypothetical protein [Caudoviricetes sp.]